jgi:FAD/FMN-containing dehydrogenase
MTASPRRGPIDGVPTHPPGSDGYARATAPSNSVARQHPALVATPTDIDQVAACVRHASRHGLTVVPQATGHGAAGELGDDVLLLDTSGLDTIAIDAEHRTARVGAGCRWGAVNAEAVKSGLLGRAGSAPTVGVAGFTFGAGAGWLSRLWGLASGALTAVDYVDGTGAVRRASDEAPDPLDRDVIWACRGGGGVGIAAALEFDLVPVTDLWAGYLLWPIDALDAVVTAWAASIPEIGPGLVTSLAVLQAAPSPLIPEQLHGTKVVHLSVASTTGAADARALLQALSGIPAPVLDTWAAADVDTLGQIHLDPPGAVPALGAARWLDDSLPSIALDVFRAAAQAPLAQVEVRNVADDAPVRPGAMDRPPGNFMLHAVGGPDTDGGTRHLEAALAQVIAAAAPSDTGLAVGSWSDGRTRVPDALPPDVRARVAAIADRVDPGRVLARSPLIVDPLV